MKETGMRFKNAEQCLESRNGLLMKSTASQILCLVAAGLPPKLREQYMKMYILMYSNVQILVFNGHGFEVNVIIQHAFIACMHLLSF